MRQLHLHLGPIVAIVFAAIVAAQEPVPTLTMSTAPGTTRPCVVFDESPDQIWAAADRYKASFDAAGFAFVPFLGADAPQNYPLHLTLRAVQVGEHVVAFAGGARPERRGDRVTFDRGAVREIYDLSLAGIEQSFVVDSALPGDLTLTLAVDSLLEPDPGQPGLRFGNTLGGVEYGAAHVVRDGRRTAIATTYADHTLQLHVPAALRGDGPVTIDPMLSAYTLTASGAQNSLSPDICYDAGMDAFLVVWQYDYSATDSDIYAEMFTGNGQPLPSTYVAIDVSGYSFSHPRTANLNSWHRHLVVMEGVDLSFSTDRLIWGRTVDANALATLGTRFLISNPAYAGDDFQPEIGGDPGTGGGNHLWLVTWTHALPSGAQPIFARLLHGDGTWLTAQVLVLTNLTGVYANPQVSQSNGNGTLVGYLPYWVIVYNFRASPTDWDVWGTTIDKNGAIVNQVGISVGAGNDLYPYVSCPLQTEPNTGVKFLVTYERQSPFEVRAQLVTALLGASVPSTSLAAAFGFGGFWGRVDSDGTRCAVVTGASNIAAATVAVVNGAFVQQDALQALSGSPSFPLLCSKRSGGGMPNEYGIVHVDTGPNPDRIVMSVYGGYNNLGGVSRRVMACNGLGIDWTGRAAIGEPLSFTLSNVGADLPLTAFGLPMPAVPLCTGCSTGLDLAQPLAIEVTFGARVIAVPPAPSLVGNTYSVQGIAAGSGACFGNLRFSDTVDFTLR